MKAALLIVAAALGCLAYSVAKVHTDAAHLNARVAAYTAGREQAIADMTGPTGPTSAPAAELCTAWWFGTNNKQQAMSQACKNFTTSNPTNSTNAKKVATP